MRVVAGAFGGRRIKSPKSIDIRPTSDFIREALFNILGEGIRGRRFLDLYAGCGTVGIEALSRGASLVIFVEKVGSRADLIEENLASLRVPPASRAVHRVDAIRYIRTFEGEEGFDYVFADPPYHYGSYDKLLRKLASSPLVSSNTLIIAEHSPSRELCFSESGLDLVRWEDYSSTRLSFFRKPEVDG